MRYRTKFWISTDGTIDAKRDFDKVLVDFASEAVLIQAKLKELAVAAAQGNLRGASASWEVNGLLDVALRIAEVLESDLTPMVLLKSALEAIGRIFKGQARDETDSGRPPPFQWTKTYPKGSHRQRLKDFVDYVRGRQKTSYEVQIKIPSCGQEYFIDVGLDVEHVEGVNEITFWKVQQGERRG